MRKRVLFLVMALTAFFTTVLLQAASAAPAIPFGSQAQSYATHIRPSVGTAAVQTATGNFYNNWKAAYLQQKCGTTPSNHYRILYNASDQTVSEAHGYGMLITVLMAGHDANAKTIFDGMYHYYRAHPATAPAASRLLAWKQDGSCNNIEGASSASDGDLDVAMSLLMADRQWGSCGTIDYRAEANAMIAQIKQYDLNSTAKYVKLGNWATSGNYLNSTRSSDFLPSHYRSFQWSTGDAAWAGLIDHTYYLVSTTAHATTGLLPDFISSPLSNPVPAPPNFLESTLDGAYNWNACRDPWRLATDYLVSGDARARTAVQKIATWSKGAPINGNPANVRAGYQLNGTALQTYSDRAFTVPMAVGAMVDASNQTLLDAFWANAQVGGTTLSSYYGDSIKLLSMIVLSGNWWQPEAMPDPCAVGTATFTRTPTRTPTRTSTPAGATATPTPGAACPVVLAYYPSWNAGTYNASNIPYSKLTHICHAFIWPNANGSLNIPASINEPALISGAHAQGVKVLISVGGATGSANFAGVAANAGYRAAFVANLKAFILANGYDGVDFDWEFPESTADMNNFTLLVQDIRTAFNTAPNAHPEWLITGAYSWTDWYARWYDFAALIPLVDFFNVMTYDAHGSWSAHSGHNAPLGAGAGDGDSISMQDVMTYYINTKGVPADKVVFGVPFYGYNFPTETLHGACPTCGTDTQSVAYKDIVGLIGAGWTRSWDASASSPYLRHDTQARVISYDDPQSIQAKADWALNTKGVRGVFMWDLSNDHLGGGNQPLLDAMRAPIACGTTSTSTSTRTSTRTATRTSTSSATQTSAATSTSSATPSSSRTQTATRTVTASSTVTVQISATSSATSTESSTRSPSPNGTLTDSPTLSSTPTHSVVVSATFTATPSASASPTATASPTLSATATRTATPALPSATPTVSPSPTQTAVNGNCRNVLAYYTSWATGYSAADIPYDKLTHICHAFIWPNADGSLNVPAGFVEPALISLAHAQGVKVLVSLGGATGSGNFSAIANNAGTRASFVAAVKNFILVNGYDGVDFDWEFPTSATDRNNFTLLVQEIRNAFNAAPDAHPEWLITGAYSWTNYYGQYYDLTALIPLVDFFNLMVYDYHGSWSAHSGHNAPLYASPGDPDGNSAQTAVNYFVNTRGVPASKVNFGLAFYGYEFPTESLHQNCPTCSSDTQTRNYQDLVNYIGNGWTRVWDAAAQSPYLTHDSDARVISYDDAQSIQAKADYALNVRGLAGVFMWDLSLDNLGGGNQPLLDAMRAPMVCGPTYTPSHTPTPVTFSVPGRIEAEDYAAYSDTTVGNSGGQYRGQDVDIEATGDVGGGFDVGWTAGGEWLDYNIDVVAAGGLDVSLRVAAQAAGGSVRLWLDGAPLSAVLTVPATGGWQTWMDLNAGNLAFPAGTHTLRVQIVAGGFNLNFLEIKVPPTPTPSVTMTNTPVPPGSTMTNTPSPTPAPPTATFSPSPGEGPLVVSRSVPGPNPNPTHFHLLLEGPADEAELRVYDRAMRVVLQFRASNLSKGWNAMPVPAEFAQLGNGTYFYRIVCRRQGRDAARPALGRVVVLR